jgi:hypothetical protein
VLLGFFVCGQPGSSGDRDTRKGELMANHFTPEELAEELGMETRDIIKLCVSEGVPIYKGKIDRSLLTAVMKSKGIQLSQPQAAAV